MNANRDLEDGDALDRALHHWTVNAPLPPRFRQGVWRRIEKLERYPETGAWPWLLRLMEWAVPRPKFAYACLSVFLVVGIAAGALAAQVKTTRLESELSLRYVQSIDPYRAGNPQP